MAPAVFMAVSASGAFTPPTKMSADRGPTCSVATPSSDGQAGVTASTVSRRTAVSAYTRPRVNLPWLNS
jgi:hypothetical protein